MMNEIKNVDSIKPNYSKDKEHESFNKIINYMHECLSESQYLRYIFDEVKNITRQYKVSFDFKILILNLLKKDHSIHFMPNNQDRFVVLLKNFIVHALRILIQLDFPKNAALESLKDFYPLQMSTWAAIFAAYFSTMDKTNLRETTQWAMNGSYDKNEEILVNKILLLKIKISQWINSGQDLIFIEAIIGGETEKLTYEEIDAILSKPMKNNLLPPKEEDDELLNIYFKKCESIAGPGNEIAFRKAFIELGIDNDIDLCRGLLNLANIKARRENKKHLNIQKRVSFLLTREEAILQYIIEESRNNERDIGSSIKLIYDKIISTSYDSRQSGKDDSKKIYYDARIINALNTLISSRCDKDRFKILGEMNDLMMALDVNINSKKMFLSKQKDSDNNVKIFWLSLLTVNNQGGFLSFDSIIEYSSLYNKALNDVLDFCEESSSLENSLCCLFSGSDNTYEALVNFCLSPDKNPGSILYRIETVGQNSTKALANAIFDELAKNKSIDIDQVINEICHLYFKRNKIVSHDINSYNKDDPYRYHFLIAAIQHFETPAQKEWIVAQLDKIKIECNILIDCLCVIDDPKIKEFVPIADDDDYSNIFIIREDEIISSLK